MSAHDLTLFGRAAVRWAEILISRGDLTNAAVWITEIKKGVEDEGALVDLCSRTDTMFPDVWRAFCATVFRNSKRVIVPVNRCAAFWDKMRPCVLASGHAGDCEPQDVPIERQHENLCAFEREYGAVVAKVTLRGGAS